MLILSQNLGSNPKNPHLKKCKIPEKSHNWKWTTILRRNHFLRWTKHWQQSTNKLDLRLFCKVAFCTDIIEFLHKFYERHFKLAESIVVTLFHRWIKIDVFVGRYNEFIRFRWVYFSIIIIISQSIPFLMSVWCLILKCPYRFLIILIYRKQFNRKIIGNFVMLGTYFACPLKYKLCRWCNIYDWCCFSRVIVPY